MIIVWKLGLSQFFQIFWKRKIDVGMWEVVRERDQPSQNSNISHFCIQSSISKRCQQYQLQHHDQSKFEISQVDCKLNIKELILSISKSSIERDHEIHLTLFWTFTFASSPNKNKIASKCSSPQFEELHITRWRGVYSF